MMLEKSVEWLARETKVLGENLPQCRFVHHKPHMCPYANPGRRGGKPASNRWATARPEILLNVLLSERTNKTKQHIKKNLKKAERNILQLRHEANFSSRFLDYL
jgi:hypothetical protein